METRADLVEALYHHQATRQRLATQPGTHGQRAAVLNRIDHILDLLREIEEAEPCFSSSASC